MMSMTLLSKLAITGVTTLAIVTATGTMAVASKPKVPLANITVATYSWCGNPHTVAPCSDTSPKKGIRIHTSAGDTRVIHACDLTKATLCFTYEHWMGGLYHTLHVR